MSKSIKQLADEFGVTKTAIRKRFTDDFREKHIHTTDKNILIIDDEGCKLIAETLQTTANQIPQTKGNQAETSENSANLLLETLQTTITMLQEQLSAKDNLIVAQQEQINILTESLHDTVTALTSAQALHAGTIQERLTEYSGTSEKDTVANGELENSVVAVHQEQDRKEKVGFTRRLKFLLTGK